MLPELFDLSGRVALVTGASRGLGKAMAIALAQAGANLALCGRDVAELEAVRKTIGGLGRQAEYFVVDLLKKDDIDTVVERIVSTFSRVDVLVNNAGVNVRKPVLEISPEEWDLVIDTNLKGSLLVTQAVVPHMLSQGAGKIINMASILGAVALPSQVAYASSKGGIIQMTKVMALEWAQHNIQVNAIGPTYFETPLVAPLRNDPQRYNFIIERTPMRRWGQPEELSGIVIFLASKASNFVTGQTIFVDGGWTIW